MADPGTTIFQNPGGGGRGGGGGAGLGGVAYKGRARPPPRMVTLQSLLGTIYNPSPGRPSAGEIVQILGTVRARCEYSLHELPFL